MRMSAKAEYAVRAMVQLATVPSGTLVKTEDLAQAQGIPAQFLVDILTNLRTDRLVRSQRGATAVTSWRVPAAKSASPTCCVASTVRWPASATSGWVIFLTLVRRYR